MKHYSINKGKIVFSLQIKRKIAYFLLSILCIELIFPLFLPQKAYATSGPKQPEFSAFQPAGADNLVDLSTGDFNYSVPVLDIDGYPLVLGYNSNITMDQEASWVGLGWNLSPGAIDRNMRGLPDDFKGDEVYTEQYTKPHTRWGGGIGMSVEIAAFDALGVGLSSSTGFKIDNYYGMGAEQSQGANLGIGSSDSKGSLNVGLGLSSGTFDGATLSPSIGLSIKSDKDKDNGTKVGFSLSSPINSRVGLQAVTMGTSLNLNGLSLFQGSGQFNFSKPTFTPKISMPTRTNSAYFSATIGGEAMFVHPAGRFYGSYSKTQQTMTERSIPAYGYMYSHTTKSKEVLHDFNRENQVVFTEAIPHLPSTLITKDIYSVSGQGMSGQFSLYKNSVGYVHDPETGQNSNHYSLGLELGLGAQPAVKFGANISGSFNTTHAGYWTDGLGGIKKLDYKKSGSGTCSDYEPVYFKNSGEFTTDSDPTFYNTIGGEDPVRFDLYKIGNTAVSISENRLMKKGNSALPLPIDVLSRENRQNRKGMIQPLTAAEASIAGVNRKIKNYTSNAGEPLTYTEEDRVKTSTKIKELNKAPHHFSEITSIDEQGVRYVYGTPIYNLYKEEVTFSVGDDGSNISLEDCSGEGIVSYTDALVNPNEADDKKNNGNGRDEYYERTITPSYPSGFLLSEVLSPDYVDLTGNGPSDDDLGKYTKFNYQKVYSSLVWRTPYEKAYFNEGFLSESCDDKASYVRGEKEIRYLHSIETRNKIAFFEVSNREDAIAPKLQGGMSEDSLKKLDKITLYSKDINGNPGELLKTVHFKYDTVQYPLCKGAPGSISGKGKLTLKEVYFTYGESSAMEDSKYTFAYNESSTDENPDYNLKRVNPWGGYMPNYRCDNSSAPRSYNSYFPFINQYDSGNNTHASAWHLKEIQLPTGGRIEVEYEMDDYAYVQDKPSMQMYNIKGMGYLQDDPISNKLYNYYGNNNQYIYIDVFNHPRYVNLSGSEKINLLRTNIIGKLVAKREPMYFKCKVKLDGDNSHKDYVPGYAYIDSYGLRSDSLVWIKLEDVCVKDKERTSSCVKTNPITKAALQFTKLNMPTLAFGYGESCSAHDLSLKQFINKWIENASNVKDLFGSFNTVRIKDSWAKEIDLNDSWVRLNEGTGFKKGGGSRVKQIWMYDDWDNMTSGVEQTLISGTEYDYSMISKDDAYKTKTNNFEEEVYISSGIAAYEPATASEENPLKQPDIYRDEYLLAPDNEQYLMKPYCEGYMPGPTVVYRQVTTRKIYKTSVNDIVRYSPTGKQVSEFYTAKDFPASVSTTGMNKIRHGTFNPKIPVAKKISDYYTATEGYSVVLNNMHGKPKSNWVYAENNSVPISGQEFIYKTDDQGKLDNNAEVLGKNGKLETKKIGVEFDAIVDVIESYNKQTYVPLDFNFDFQQVAIVPLFLIVPIANYKAEETRFRSAVITKVVRKAGILEKVITHDNTATLETENVVYEGTTGQVILSSVENNFGDKTYNFSLPAYHVKDFKGMSPAWNNMGVSTLFSNLVSGYKLPSCSLFVPGDELMVVAKYNNGSVEEPIAFKAWVKEGGKLVLKNGEYVNSIPDITGPYYVKVLRSGNKNMLSSSAGSVVTMSNPFDVNGNFAPSNVLSATGIRYKDTWQGYCFDNASFSNVNTINSEVSYHDYTNNWFYDFLIENQSQYGALESILEEDTKYKIVEVACDASFEIMEKNPYVFGLKGNWRPEYNATYLTNRNPNVAITEQPKVKDDGTYEQFTFLYIPSSYGWQSNPSAFTTTNHKWTFQEKLLKIDAFGNPLESVDAMDRYKASILGYDYQAVEAEAVNAKYTQVAFRGFEDEDMQRISCEPEHLPEGSMSRTEEESHSGKYSVKVKAGGQVLFNSTVCD